MVSEISSGTTSDDDKIELLGQWWNFLGELQNKLRDLKGFRTLIYELMQNADDAEGVTEMTFQIGPEAVEVRNNGRFREKDFARMQDLGAGDKRKEANTTGALGFGFITAYLITDRPEVESAGRHWTMRPELLEAERVAQRRVPDRGGTRFRFPWAFDASDVRDKLKVEPLTPHAIFEFLDTLREVVPQAILFLRRVSRVDFGLAGEDLRTIKCQGERTAVEHSTEVSVEDSGQLYHWHILHGNFDADAAKLRATHGDRIEPPEKRSASVRLALPADGRAVEGLFFVTLPTQERLGMPFHVNADFFPRTDRKGLILDSDYQGDWNRAAVRGAARTLAAAAPRLPMLLQKPEQVWQLLKDVEAVSHQSGPEVNSAALVEFWKALKPAAMAAPIVLTRRYGWQIPRETFLLNAEDEEFAHVATLAEMRVADSRIDKYRDVMSSLGLPDFSVNHLVEAIRRAAPQSVWLADAPLWLGESDNQELLARQLERFLTRCPPDLKRALREELKSCVIAPGTDGRLHAPRNLLAADQGSMEVFAPLPLVTPFLDASAPKFVRQITPPLDAKAAIDQLIRLPRAVFDDLWRSDRSAVLSLIDWFAKHSRELTPSSVKSLRSLTIWPSSSGLHTLGELAIPAGKGFKDPLHLARMVDEDVVARHTELLRKLYVSELTLAEYTTKHVPEVFRVGRPRTETIRELVGLLARSLKELQNIAGAKEALEQCDLAECTDGKFRRPGSVYLPEADAVNILGEVLPVACLPEHRAAEVSDFLEWLEAAKAVRPSDVVARVYDLVKDAPTPEKRLILNRILLHVASRWTDEVAAERQLEWDSLRTVGWLPSRNDPAQWHKPTELYASFHRNLFHRSGASFLDLSLKEQHAAWEFLDFLGIQASPSPSLVVEHLLSCARDGSDLDLKVYSFLNRHNSDPAIKGLVGQRCLLLSDGSYHSPELTFLKDHGFGRFGVTLGHEWTKYLDLLRQIGVAERPTPAHAVEVLKGVSKESQLKNWPAVEPGDREVVWYCWEILDKGKAFFTMDLRHEFKGHRVVLNDQQVLQEPSGMYLNDRLALAEKFRDHLQHFLVSRRDGAWRALIGAGVRELHKCVSLMLLPPRVSRPNSFLQNRLAERRQLLKRVLDRLREKDPEWDVKSLDHVKINDAEPLRVRYNLDFFGDLKTVSSETEPVFLDETSQTIFVAPPGERPSQEFWIALARELATVIRPAADAGQVSAQFSFVLGADSLGKAASLLELAGILPLDGAASPTSTPEPGAGMGAKAASAPEEYAVSPTQVPEPESPENAEIQTNLAAPGFGASLPVPVSPLGEPLVQAADNSDSAVPHEARRLKPEPSTEIGDSHGTESRQSEEAANLALEGAQAVTGQKPKVGALIGTEKESRSEAPPTARHATPQSAASADEETDLSEDTADWVPECSPEQARGSYSTFTPRVVRIGSGRLEGKEPLEKDTMLEEEAHQLPTQTQAKRIQRKRSEPPQGIGRWGESFALEQFKDELSKKYRYAEIQTMRVRPVLDRSGKPMRECEGYRFRAEGVIVATLKWMNYDQESKLGFDIKIQEPSGVSYVEVKTTVDEARKDFELSAGEWEMAKQNRSKYQIGRVYNAGREQFARLENLTDPYGMWLEGTLEVRSLRIVI